MREVGAEKDDVRWMRAGEFDRRAEAEGMDLVGRYVRVSKRHPAGDDVIYLAPWCLACDAGTYAEREWCSMPVWDPCEGYADKWECKAAPVCYTREP